MALELPFPSNPTRPGKYVMYFHNAHNYPLVHIFCATYAAKKFLDIVLADDPYEVTGKRNLMTASGLRLRCEGLHEIMDHKYSKEEAAWNLPVPYPKEAEDVRMCTRVPGFTLATEPKLVVVGDGEGKKGYIAPPKKEKKPKVSRDGLTSIADIAKELGVHPRDARKALRSSKVSKPDAGWAWPKDQLDEIKKKVQKGLKK